MHEIRSVQPASSPAENGQIGLNVTPLGPDDETAAYSLALWAKPELTQERWDNFLCDWRSHPDSRGILVARNQRGAILGFVLWWQQPDLDHGETVWAGPFYVREMGVRPLVRDALEHSLQQHAAAQRAVLRFTPENDSGQRTLSTLV